MGKRGPAPEPTALKVVKGTKSAEAVDEPVPAAGEVTPPEDLSSDALAVWESLAPDLIAKGVLTPWDVHAFALYCDAVARTDEARRHLDEEGTVVEQPVFDRNGRQQEGRRTVRSLWTQVLSDNRAAVIALGTRFGLTPSERSTLKVGNGNDDTGRSPARLLS